MKEPLNFSIFYVVQEIRIKENGTNETNKTKLKIVCNNVHQYNFKETYTDYIDEAYLKYITINKEEYICFVTDKEEPLLSVVCKKIEYKKLNN